MRRSFVIFSFSVVIFSGPLSRAQTPQDSPLPTASSATKKVLPKNFFEGDSEGSNFSAKVKLIREIAGDTEVFFADDKLKGAYVLPSSHSQYGLYYNRLVKSSKDNGPQVMISADDNHNIVKVEFPEAVSGQGAGSGLSPEELAKKIRGK